VEKLWAGLSEEVRHFKKPQEVPFGLHGLDQMPQGVHLHPQGPGLLHQEAVPVQAHPQVELRPVPEAPQELQQVDLGPPRLSAGDEVKDPHLFAGEF